ncbi:hypothetical protein FPO73_04640 [Staphylococcus aureus]|nr:hypothetical protein FPO73_04640 [Staphylococcus aureus]
MKFKYHISQQETVKAFLARHDFSKKTVSAIKNNGALIVVLHQMWWVYNLKNYFKLQLLEFLLLGGQSIIGLGCLLFFSFV